SPGLMPRPASWPGSRRKKIGPVKFSFTRIRRRSIAPWAQAVRITGWCPSGGIDSASELRLLLFHGPPDLDQLDQHADGVGHLFQAGPLQWRVDVVLAAEDVRRRQAHLGQPGAVCS